MKNLVAGVDIGGTHVTVCLVDIASGHLLKETYSRISIDPSMDKKAVIQTWASVIKESFDKAQLDVGKVGIAMPGPFDYEKGISYIKGLHKYESLYGENVKDLLGAALQIAPSQVRMINDASAYLLGEMNCGAGAGLKNLVGITLGTGLGSAAYYNNQLEEGDLYCTDFGGGKAEDFISARWLLKNYEAQTGEKLHGVKELAIRVDNDDAAKELFKTFGQNLGKVLVQRYRIQSPEMIIVGGNISKAWDVFMPEVNQTIGLLGNSFNIRPAQLGEDAALIGASYLHAS